MAMGEAADVAMGEAASTEAQQRRQRKWEAAAEGQVVAEVVVFSSEEEEEEMEEEGQKEEEMSEVTEEEVVAEAQWQWLLGSAKKQEEAQQEQQKDVWVELRWCAKKEKEWFTKKRETQKHHPSPMTTAGEYTLFRLAVFFFSLFLSSVVFLLTSPSLFVLLLYVLRFSCSFVVARSLMDTCRRLSSEIWLKLAVLRHVLFAL